MDSNADNLTQENMSNDTSLASIESGFVSLNGLGTKEQMAVEIDLIPKMEKDKGFDLNFKQIWVKVDFVCPLNFSFSRKCEEHFRYF